MARALLNLQEKYTIRVLYLADIDQDQVDDETAGFAKIRQWSLDKGNLEPHQITRFIPRAVTIQRIQVRSFIYRKTRAVKVKSHVC